MFAPIHGFFAFVVGAAITSALVLIALQQIASRGNFRLGTMLMFLTGICVGLSSLVYGINLREKSNWLLSPASAVEDDLDAISTVVEEHYDRYGAFPVDLESLSTGVGSVDPWGQPYRYRSDGRSTVIWSRGPDHMDNTDDDIDRWVQKESSAPHY